MQYLIDIGVFSAKAFVLAMALIVVIAVIFQFAGRGRGHRPQLDVEKLNSRYRAFRRALQGQILQKKEFKALVKADKKKAKNRNEAATKKKLYVVDYHGDIRAAATESLREEITAILSVATKDDEVIVRLESPGGMVAGYGLAAAQLQRVRERGIPLTVCVDKVAASGGYMMACVADKILAAPFAIVGSVGVIAAFANVHRLLEKHNVDYREVTAGEFKRTVSMFGEITPAGFEKFKSQIQDTHELFKHFVQANRPSLDVQAISTGEYWYGLRAQELRLIDGIETSDDYLWKQHETAEILRVKYSVRRPIAERLSESFANATHTILEKIVKDIFLARFGI